MEGKTLLIGPSVEYTGTFCGTLIQNQYPTCQFLSTQQPSKIDLDACKIVCQKRDIRFFIHTHLASNLAKDDASNTLRSLRQTLAAVKDLPAAAVLHIGKAVDQASEGKRPDQEQRGKAIANVVKRLNSLQLTTKPILLLENAAGQGREIGDTWEDIRKIKESLDVGGIGFCLDTQHAFAAGLTDWKDYEETNRVFDKIEEIGLPLGLVHLNDSAVKFESRVDRHASIGKGYIWNKDTDSLIELLARCGEKEISIVLETPSSQNDLKYIYDKFL